MRIHDYSSIINSSILLKENKFDLASKEITLLNNNWHMIRTSGVTQIYQNNLKIL